MTDKYYVPELIEFRVGIEYEIRDKNKWIKAIFETCDTVERAESFIKHNELRVKFLDHEDILACGWEFSRKGAIIPDSNKPIYDATVYAIQMDKVRFRICVTPNIFCIIKTGEDGGDIVFKGVIKNKSELKLLMKMLNIKP